MNSENCLTCLFIYNFKIKVVLLKNDENDNITQPSFGTKEIMLIKILLTKSDIFYQTLNTLFYLTNKLTLVALFRCHLYRIPPEPQFLWHRPFGQLIWLLPWTLPPSQLSTYSHLRLPLELFSTIQPTIFIVLQLLFLLQQQLLLLIHLLPHILHRTQQFYKKLDRL